ncbi:hypothetical protein F511_43294 [Dorcoceras hygrometricum]|uniref:Uncharacterized protein n=1 Tax=Dorcoceras hygrometricum TaxID=472368 RepID=A0A2Z7CG76_9LAMI|nr:hypothetical protein F511_43294 [Dorcoceras hygrometricum]
MRAARCTWPCVQRVRTGGGHLRDRLVQVGRRCACTTTRDVRAHRPASAKPVGLCATARNARRTVCGGCVRISRDTRCDLRAAAPGADQFHKEIDTSTVEQLRPHNSVHDRNLIARMLEINSDGGGEGRRGREKILAEQLLSHFHPSSYYTQQIELNFRTGIEKPEGSSIDHQVTIYLHAQNITMFPTNETWYFTSQMLVSSSGGPYSLLDGPID